MQAYFVTDYTIHFDDTMAYGGHHFLTAFKWQCASREAFLFGEHIFDRSGVKEALAGVHLLTSDAYARNLQSMQLGDRVVIMLTLEEWGRASARFCYRVLDHRGDKVCAGFQTLICADARSGVPVTMPTALSQAMDRLRDVEERRPKQSFREIVLAGGAQLDDLFGDSERQLAIEFLADRYPRPAVVRVPAAFDSQHPVHHADSKASSAATEVAPTEPSLIDASESSAWAFSGQGTFDVDLFCRRLSSYSSSHVDAAKGLQACSDVIERYYGTAANHFLSADKAECHAAVQSQPGLSQVAILLQNVLGAELWRLRGQNPAILIGHSFGEIAAFQLAGCFDMATAVEVVCLRNQAIERYAPAQSGLIAVFAERHLVRTEASILGLSRLSIAGRNHDMQSIVSGPLDQLDQIQIRFQQLGIQTAKIQSPTSFHHADLNQAATHWLESMRQLSMRPPAIPIYSPIGRRMIASTDEPASVLASQLLRPFDLQGAIQDLEAMGVTQIVDCGSSGSLAKLLAKAAFSLADVLCAASLENVTQRVPNALPQITAQSVDQGIALPTTAIVGRGCILPAGATCPEELFASVMQRRVGLVDQRTLDPNWTEDFYSEKLVPDRSTSHLSGLVNEIDIKCPGDVDERFFQSLTRTQKMLCIALSPCLAGLRDAKRIVCLMGATADGFEDQDEATSLIYAGIDPSEIEIDRMMNSARSAHQTPHQAVQSVLDQMVRPGIQLVLVDAACASSLYTTALGMRLLESDQADAVIVGGVFCPGPGNSCLFSQFRGTTATGCRPFDAGADGVVFSEGAALLTLRRSTDAARLGLKIDAVIRGAGLSSDGRSSSANVPQSHGQILSLQRCYRRYQIDPASISGIEGHGTSTPVGDSTEVETLRAFFSGHVTSPIPLHSLKGSIGHAGWAAGTASVIAACEYLHQRTFPAQGFFSNPSEAVGHAAGVLAVPTEPISIGPKQRRIAVDGFGFGGANAHLVIEAVDRDYHDPENISPPSQRSVWSTDTRSDDLVIVAVHQIEPNCQSQRGTRFDRDAIKLPSDFIVLPELSDDMDISQTLTVLLTHHIIGGLSGFDSDVRNETCVVLAMNGKTERGVEATTRVLSQRLKRDLASKTDYVERIERAYDQARPSKAYTLQCMMPNVASGRAALLHNLRGPNFVVDSGDQSLDAALLSAALLLTDGGVSARVAIVAAISANTGSDPYRLGSQHVDEYAAAFALTTKEVANQHGWEPLLELTRAKEYLQSFVTKDASHETTASRVQLLIDQMVKSPSKAIVSSANDGTVSTSVDTVEVETSPIHTPIWVEKSYFPVEEKERVSSSDVTPATLFICQGDAELVGELLNASVERLSRSRMIILGEHASQIVAQHPQHDLHAVSELEQPEILTELVSSFSADLIVAAQRPKRHRFLQTLRDVANDNGLCEALFLAAQKEIERLHAGHLEIWSLIVDGWSDEVHPCSGASAGLLKSIAREIPGASMGTFCTSGIDVAGAIEGLLAEIRHGEGEPEIVLDGNQRRVRRLMPIVPPSAPKPQVELDERSVIVASGGARGVTAVMLEAIVRDVACTIIALGRSPLESGPVDCDDPEIETRFYRQFLSDHPHATLFQMRREFESARARWEAAQNIDLLRSLGAHVEYHVVDVTVEEEVSRVIADIAGRYGRIDFLIHGAGVQVSKQLQHRSLAEFRKTYQVKVKGLHLLVNSCFEYFGKLVDTHVLTSAYSIFGNDGQHDYCAANETMDRLCQSCCQSAASRWTSIAWLAWDGIGMTRGSEYKALAQQRSLSGIDEPTGQRLFRAVVSGRTGAAVNVPLSPAEHRKYRVATVPSPDDGKPCRWMEIPIDLREIDCLPFHKVRNSPTLPGAWIVNQFVDAASKLFACPAKFAEARVRDIAFLRFVRSSNGQDPNIRVIARQHESSIDVWMVADLFHASGQLLAKDMRCASAKIEFREPAKPNSKLSDPGFDKRFATFDDPYCRRNSLVELSGPFQCLSEISIDRENRRAVFDNNLNGDWTTITPALALDAAWRVGAMYAGVDDNTLFVPVNIEEVYLPLRPGETFTSHKRWTIVSTGPHVDQNGAHWSRTEVCDEDGNLQMLVRNAYAKPIN